MITTTSAQVLAVAVVVFVVVGGSVLVGLIAGIHHERRRNFEEHLFRARMDAYYQQARQIRDPARGETTPSGHGTSHDATYSSMPQHEPEEK